MPLGLRFPKTFEFSETPNPAASPSFQPLFILGTASGTPYAPQIDLAWLPMAPARYSQVRKVVFWCNARFNSATVPGRLRIAILPITAGTKTPFPVTIAPGDIINTQTQSWDPTFDAGSLFDQAGPASSNNLPSGTDRVGDAATLLRVEFDRFDPGSADFFAAWDSVTDNDDYLFFRFVVERTDGNNWPSNSTNAGSFANIACTVVQAPSTNNRSCTVIGISQGMRMNGSMSTSALTGTLASYFRYVASEWDNIVSVTALNSFFQYTGGGSINLDWQFDVARLTSFEPEAVSSIYNEQRSLSGNLVGSFHWYRSQDLLAQLQDGDFVTSSFQQLPGSNTVNHHASWLEIIQEGYTNTVCHHPFGSAQRNGFNTGSLYGSPATGYFDPQWYQSIPDEIILERRLYLAFLHLASASPVEVRLHLDSSNESDVTGLSNTTVTLAGIDPTCTATPTASLGIKTRFPDAFSPDPIALAGTRRLVWGIVQGTTSTQDFGGDGGVYYVLAVPEREIPLIGNVFPIGEFNPEGCASTAAGGGQPGVLIISNGTSIPKKFNPLANSIEDAGIPEPFCGETLPSSSVDDVATGLQAGEYRYRYTFRNCCTGKESNPNDEDILVDTTGASPAAEVTLNFTNVRIPGDPQICEICIYRTSVSGAFPVMAKVGCFDPSTSATFVDDLPDADLDFENESISQLNAPPPCTPIVVEIKGRIAYMGDIPQLSPAGTVSVTQGSDIVLGSADVEWDRCLEGKYIQLEGDCMPYEIDCVMPPAMGTSPPIQRLKLLMPYEGANQTGALYTICGRPNRIWFSEPFEPEYVPEASFLDVEPGDGDRIMGAVSNFDSLVVCKRRKTFVLRWRDNPVTEIAYPTRVSSDIGCIAPRSFAQVESGSVWLSDRGLALYDGRSVGMVPESSNFDAFFTDAENPNYVRRDSLGRVIGAVGVYYPKRKQYLLLLPTVQTTRGANLLMVWDTHLRNVTVHKFCQEFLSMVVGKDAEGNQRVFVGDTNGFVWMLDIGYTDGVGTPGQTKTVQGTLTAGGIDDDLGASFLEDETATFITGGIPDLAGLSGTVGLSAAFDGNDLGLAGVCVYFRAPGATLWESRTIFASTTQRLFVTPPLPVGESLAGYEYMIGPIDFRAEFKPTNYGDDDTLKRNWRQIIVHEPEDVSSVVKVEIIPDFQLSDDEEGSIVNEAGDTGDGRTFDMNFSRGRQTRPVGRRLFDYEQIVITNFAPNSPVRLLNHVMAAAPHTSK